LELRRQIRRLEDLLLFVALQIEQARQQVREAQRIVDPHHERPQLLREPARHRERPIDQLLQTADVGVDLEGAREFVGLRRHRRPQHRVAARDRLGPRARQSLDDDVDAAGGHLRHLPNRRDRADLVQVIRMRLVVVAVLERQKEQAVAGQRPIDRFDRHRPVDRERLKRQRKDDGASKRQEGKLAGIRPRGFGRHDPSLRIARGRDLVKPPLRKQSCCRAAPAMVGFRVPAIALSFDLVTGGRIMAPWRQTLAVALFVVSIALPAAAQVQTGSITGTVTDASSAVLPGVTVTLTGEKLIGGAQTQVSDTTGAYRFDRLPPGAYTVKFELQGFKTVTRDDIRINAAFVATVNARLEVGSVNESITVTGDAPTVDTRSNVQQTVLNQDVLEGIPTGRDPWSNAKLVAGLSVSTYDVGGTQSYQQSNFSAHGSSTNDVSFNIDG